jgi:ketosteroid isomerase-like protein
MKFRFITLVKWIVLSSVISSCEQKVNENVQNTDEVNLSKLEKEIEIRLRTYEDYLKNGDSIALGEMYMLDAEIIPSTVGRDNIIKAFGGMIRDSIIGTFETIHLWGNDQLLVEEGKGSWAHKNGAVLVNGRYLLVWQKDNGEWKIVRDTWFPTK